MRFGFVSALAIPAMSVGAQLTLPAVATRETGVSTLPISAAEAAYHVEVQDVKLKAAVSVYSAHYPLDSIQGVVSTTGAHWLAQLKDGTVQGIQLDPSGRVGVAANQDAYAKKQIATRLATPGLSFSDKAFTYATAVRAFASVHHPERLPIAEAYLVELDAMGDSAAPWQFRARVALVDAYYQLGRSAAVIQHGTRAIHLVPIIPFHERYVMFPFGRDLYTATVDALTGQPGGRAKVEPLNVILRAATVPPSALVSLDSDFVRHGDGFKIVFDRLSATNARLGTTGAPIISNYWVNQPTRDSQTVVVNDGKIRVIEVAGTGCAPCLAALQGVQRVTKAFPGIEGMFVTWTSGSWGNRFVEPEEEAAKLTDFFLNTAKVTIPIAIWKGKKVLNEDGGMTPDGFGPNLENYPLTDKAVIWVLDGKGTIRRIFIGLERDQEVQLVRTVQFLQREAATQ